MAMHPLSDRIEPRPRDRHRHQGARIDASRREHGADPAHHTAPPESREALQHFTRPAVEAARHLRERHGAYGKVALVRVEQLSVQPVEPRLSGTRNAGRAATERGKNGSRCGPRASRPNRFPVHRTRICKAHSDIGHLDSLLFDSHAVRLGASQRRTSTMSRSRICAAHYRCTTGVVSFRSIPYVQILIGTSARRPPRRCTR